MYHGESRVPLYPGGDGTEGKRKRNKSVTNMEKASIEPPEEEEEERPVVNGNGVVITPGQSLTVFKDRQLFVLF